MLNGTPAAEVPIDGELVRGLLREQFPDLSGEPLALLDSGWDNEMYRLGNELLVRLPRRPSAVPLLEREQAWLPSLAKRLPIPVPVPVCHGSPSDRFPWPWSILSWLPGKTADLAAPARHQGRRWARFLRALHLPAPEEAPDNPLRGCPLEARKERVEEGLGRLRQDTESITPVVLEIWERALEAPEAAESCWLHGDLHARNVLVEGGKISGVIDWGDLTAGDAATDLASVWSLLGNPVGRAECLSEYGPPEDLLARAKGWAVFFATMLLDTGRVDHPRHAAMGRAIFRRLEEDA